MSRLGLIAGNGRFPLLFLEAAKAEGTDIVVVAHEGETPPEIAALMPNITWIQVGELGKIIDTLKAADVTQAVMAGGISKAGAFAHFQPDERGMAFISRLPNLKDDVILRGVAQELENEGILIIESTRFLSTLVPTAGILTSTAPNSQQWDDIRLGFTVAKEIGRWDVGQSVIIKRGTIIAVEGIEGTSETIRRGGTLAGAGTIVVKVSKPQQDLRFDVPAVGPETIDIMREVNAAVLAIEAKRTLMLDKLQVLERANAAALCIVALDH